MTMHLMSHAYTTTNTRKRKAKKLTNKRLEELKLQWRQYNKQMRRNNSHSLQYDTFEDYLSYVQGNPPKPQPKKERELYVPPTSYQRETKSYPSYQGSGPIPGSCAKKDSPKYTGDLIVGIATMHKSNAVPVMRGTDQAKDIARMRR